MRRRRRPRPGSRPRLP
uniref:Uncharacterized protein n=1 Tax=Arundo donax TaxID=35708 RepID=A0A0A9FPU5_ARUDO